ncbi:glycosyltransferase family 2 protein [Lysobacter sp. CFH 32150]|uniref:glycosyltransferase family 2 protein n=1 Tax=Lysobacter sp. CFH 32150 TaxID=2927128 RepID=UPI001FA77F0C|nr:glycosyltransferase family 2 protein [Lysobacter sp. CFH 32150]MCI4567723.1 glycosyltransferase [Lysobacter sp. CFH 32150]
MKVQVFIPTFNRSERLAKAVASVLGQTFSDVEVVVLDNHSTDDTPVVMASLMASDHRVRLVRHAENIGMMANFNAIQGLANSDFFTVLTDDDEYEPCFIETAMQCFAGHQSAGFVACNAPTRIDGQVVKSQLDYWREGFYKSGSAVSKCLLGHYPLVTNCLFRAETKGDFYFDPALGIVSDGLLLTCMFAKYDAVISKTVTGYWDNHGGNASSVHRLDPAALVDAAITEARLYREFCGRNGIPVRGRLLSWFKQALTVLVAADKSSFEHVHSHSLMQQRFGWASMLVLRGVHGSRLIRVFTWALAMGRRRYTAWVARQSVRNRHV